MATLSDSNIDDLHLEIMRQLSEDRDEIPVSKSLLRALLVGIDAELEAAEVSIVQALPSGAAKTWLVGNQSAGREIIKRVVSARKENF